MKYGFDFFWIVIGFGIGVAAGIANDNVAAGIGVGVVSGLIVNLITWFKIYLRENK